MADSGHCKVSVFMIVTEAAMPWLVQERTLLLEPWWCTQTLVLGFSVGAWQAAASNDWKTYQSRHPFACAEVLGGMSVLPGSIRYQTSVCLECSAKALKSHMAWCSLSFGRSGFNYPEPLVLHVS